MGLWSCGICKLWYLHREARDFGVRKTKCVGVLDGIRLEILIETIFSIQPIPLLNPAPPAARAIEPFSLHSPL